MCHQVSSTVYPQGTYIAHHMGISCVCRCAPTSHHAGRDVLWGHSSHQGAPLRHSTVYSQDPYVATLLGSIERAQREAQLAQHRHTRVEEVMQAEQIVEF